MSEEVPKPHDQFCEKEWEGGAMGYTNCGCSERVRQSILDSELEQVGWIHDYLHTDKEHKLMDKTIQCQNCKPVYVLKGETK